MSQALAPVLLALTLVGCFPGKTSHAAPAIAPQPISLPAVKPVDEKPPEISPPDGKAPAPAPDSAKALEVPPSLPGPPAPKRVRRTIRPRPLPAAVTVTPPPPAPPVIAEPELAPLLSEDQKSALVGSINDLVGKTETNLRIAEAHTPLSDHDRQLVQQARTFIAQALEARSRDLATAKSLAQRAEILSRELAGK